MAAMNSATAVHISMVLLSNSPAAAIALMPCSPPMSSVPKHRQQHRRADEQPHVAGTHREERLQRGPAVGLFLPPVTDEHERAEAHDLPAEDELHHVRREHHREHAGGEQREAGEEVRVAAVAAHVLGGVDLHERADERDQQQRHDGEAVDLLADGEREPAGRPPGDGLGDGLGLFGVVDQVDPLVRGAGRDDELATMLAMPISLPPLGIFLPKRMMRKNATGRDERDEPGVFEEPARGVRRLRLQLLLRTSVSPSFPTVRRARCSCGCGRSASPSPGPTPTSAAATAMMNSANTLPSEPPFRRSKASRLMLTELRTSSTLSSTMTAFLRVITPYTPMQNSRAPRIRN